jgi:hypothetical protein
MNDYYFPGSQTVRKVETQLVNVERTGWGIDNEDLTY